MMVPSWAPKWVGGPRASAALPAFECVTTGSVGGMA